MAGTLDHLSSALAQVLTPEVILFILIGLIVGMVLAATPGVGGVLGMTILLPLTLSMSGLEASILLTAIYSGSAYGASISAILFNVPGTVASAATTFDGYSLTQQGRAIDALAISATASALGGIITMATLFVAVPYLPTIVGAFQTHHIFLIAIFGVLIIAVIASKGSLTKGAASGLFGLLIMTIGTSPGSAAPRFTLDLSSLYNGFDFIAIVIGMFALGEMLRIGNESGSVVSKHIEVQGSVVNGMAAVAKSPVLLVKSGFIGMIIGSIPGAGSATSNFFSYIEALRSSDDQESFGTGNPDGVIAAEAANNGTVAGSLMPVIAFGIPGSAATAILLGAFNLHGVDPGAPLFTDNIDFTFALILSLIISSIFILLLGNLVVTRIGAAITRINIHSLIPMIIVLGTIGVFSLRYFWLDVATFFVFGLVAFLMAVHDYSIVAFVLGAVLSDIIETNLQRSLVLSDGSLGIFVSDPLAIVIWCLIVVFFYFALVKPIKNDIDAGSASEADA